MTSYRIRRAAVLGAGTMGSRIAAHLANAGIPSFLLDIAPRELTAADANKGLSPDSPSVRNSIVTAGWKAALAGKPPALFNPELASQVSLGNFTDNLSWVREADWILEAVTEKLEIKRSLIEQLEQHRKPGTIVSSNTSGIPIHRIAEGFPEDFRKHFLGTHFFNPPRYLHLLEIIPTPDTDPALVQFMAAFGENLLGKGVVLCKDTPNFIGNRIGIYGACVALHAMVEDGLTVEEVDLLTGPLLGRPKSATFRTFDVVGLDTMAHVSRNLYESLTEGEREVFQLPPFLTAMLQNKWLGDKTGQGFYKRLRGKDGTEIQFLDYTTLEYHPLRKPGFPELEKASKIRDDAKRLRALLSDTGRAGRFLWKVLSATLAYAAARAPEITDDITSIDKAMKWGFLHRMGPFETWDALGVERVADRLRQEGKPVPQLVQDLLDAGGKAFYKQRSGRTYFFAPSQKSHLREPERPECIVLRALKERKKVVLENPGASLIDLGDDVACLEFHTKMNIITGEVIRMINESLDEVARNFAGMVIANEGENFSAGANLVELLGAARAGQWQAIEAGIRAFQAANMRLRYSEKPVVIAPHNMTLGGACEIAVHADQIHASAELYMGFVEVGVGLIPAAGGCKEMALRAAAEAGSDSDMDLTPRIRKVFELIAMAKVSTSALEARQLGLLREKDHVSMNAEHRIRRAKDDVLALAKEGYRPPVPRLDIPVLGEPGLATLKLGLHMMQRAGYISEYDKVIGTHLAKILTGGSFLGVGRVSEQQLLDLECEAFLSLCGQAKTQERMEYMLKEGKPLRN
ncbi:MAG TPA: 3-hydroxyacyl-CoA dehydrogenase NAD-binding domain-containing protein [Acidobacteriota bacterium]|nr:3-hydroxyacyl-CoA dehydrogenase NAD-binding domain-containing protein [Acidobacteriota bacterium]